MSPIKFPFSVAGITAEAEHQKRLRDRGKVDQRVEVLYAKADKHRNNMASTDMGPELFTDSEVQA